MVSGMGQTGSWSATVKCWNVPAMLLSRVEALHCASTRWPGLSLLTDEPTSTCEVGGHGVSFFLLIEGLERGLRIYMY